MYTPSIEKIATIKFIILSSTKIAQCKNTNQRRFFFPQFQISLFLSLIPSARFRLAIFEDRRKAKPREACSSTVVRAHGRIKAVGGTNFHVDLALRIVVPA